MSPERITYVGHATVLIEIAGVRLLTDPVLRPRLLQVIDRHPAEPAAEVTEGIDAVLLSHLHHDHLDFPSLRRLDRGTPVVVPAGGARTLRRRGFTNPIELRTGEGTAVGGAEITATRAVHNGRRFKFGPMVEAAGYEIEAAGRGIYFAGDTGLFAEMDELAGRLDVALLPIAGWGPRLGAGHLNPRSAAEAAARIRPRIVIPIHWGTLIRRDMRRRATEFLADPPRRLAAQLSELAPGVELSVLPPGGSLDLSGLPVPSDPPPPP
jgi:L-ascorbate metabolism protein UlaG (beta-lactamase superfamily)